MIRIQVRLLRALGVLTALALGLSLAAPMIASAHERAPAHGKAVLPIGDLQSSGTVADVLSASQFVLALSGGDVLAVNVAPSTTIVNDTTGATSTGPSAAITTGAYALVTYHFDARTGAVASRIVLSTSPLPTGPVHHAHGMVTAVGTNTFTLENANGVSFTIAILPSTRMRWVESSAGSSPAAATMPPLAVGDFAAVDMRSAGSAYDAVQVTYSTAPLGVRSHQAIQATVSAVSGSTLDLTLENGGTLSATVLPSALIELNGQAVSLTQIHSGDFVRVHGVHFVGVFYATTVVATSTSSAGG